MPGKNRRGTGAATPRGHRTGFRTIALVGLITLGPGGSAAGPAYAADSGAVGKALRPTQVALHELQCQDVDGRIVELLFSFCALAGAQLTAGCTCQCPNGTVLTRDNYEKKGPECAIYGEDKSELAIHTGVALMRSALESLTAAESLTGGEPLGGQGAMNARLAAYRSQGEPVAGVIGKPSRASGGSRGEAGPSPDGAPDWRESVPEQPDVGIAPRAGSLFERIHKRYQKIYSPE